MREEVRKEVPVPEIRKEGRKGRKGRKEGNEGRKERKEGRKERKERKEGKRFQYCIIELIISRLEIKNTTPNAKSCFPIPSIYKNPFLPPLKPKLSRIPKSNKKIEGKNKLFFLLITLENKKQKNTTRKDKFK